MYYKQNSTFIPYSQFYFSLYSLGYYLSEFIGAKDGEEIPALIDRFPAELTVEYCVSVWKESFIYAYRSL